MKKVIITAVITACLALCAAVWPQAETIGKTPHPNSNARRERPKSDYCGTPNRCRNCTTGRERKG